MPFSSFFGSSIAFSLSLSSYLCTWRPLDGLDCQAQSVSSHVEKKGSLIVSVALLASHFIFGPLPNFVFVRAADVSAHALDWFPSIFLAFKITPHTLFTLLRKCKRRYPLSEDVGKLPIQAYRCKDGKPAEQFDRFQTSSSSSIELKGSPEEHLLSSLYEGGSLRVPEILYSIGFSQWFSVKRSFLHFCFAGQLDSWVLVLVLFLRALQRPTSLRSTPRISTKMLNHSKVVEYLLWFHSLL